jgi:hypothetical protein
MNFELCAFYIEILNVLEKLSLASRVSEKAHKLSSSPVNRTNWGAITKPFRNSKKYKDRLAPNLNINEQCTQM